MIINIMFLVRIFIFVEIMTNSVMVFLLSFELLLVLLDKREG